MFTLFLILLSISFFLVSYLLTNRLSYFKIRSINCPPHRSIIFGHLYELWSARSYSEQLRQWTKKYGSIYGIFEGFRPVYVISDIKLLQQVFITQFNHFYARRTPLINRILGEDRLHLFASNSFEQWKRQRIILNPAFSSLKLKRLIPIINSCLDVFIGKLSLNKLEMNLNILNLYKQLTMDIICRCAFGIETQIQNDVNQNNIYMKKVEEVLENDFDRSYLAKIHRVMPFSFLANLCAIVFRLKYFFQTDNSSVPANVWLIDHMYQFIQQRSHQIDPSKKNNDLLQLMIDAIQSDQNKLSSPELLSNVYLMMAAGFETTTTALGYCTYRLSIHQDIQNKLYEEINQMNLSDRFSYETINQNYIFLDQFVSEVLRMHPIAIQPVHRQCVKDTFVENYFIEKDSLIQVDVLSIHYNSEYWGPQPVDEFHPERHSLRRHPMALMPFGAGPRTCLGMRFALLEIKLCLARLISEYQIYALDDTEQKLNISEEFVITPEQIYVKFVKRSN